MSETGELPISGVEAVILDSTALLALGAGSRGLSRAYVSAQKGDGMNLFAPALCLAAAVAERPALADHIGGLTAITILDLTYATASITGALVSEGIDWRHAQAIADSRPSVEWPKGIAIATTNPQFYPAQDGIHFIRL